MRGKQIKLVWLVCTVVLASCHSYNNKKAVNTVSQKDTAKVAASKPITKETPKSFLILDTIVKKDTIKVLLYRDSMIRCSINNLYDTFSVNPINLYWDEDYFGNGGNQPPSILVPGSKKPRSFILNDSLLLIPVPSWRGNTALLLLNRTKNRLKFVKCNNDNPILHYSYYVYVDMKHNSIIDFDKQVYDDEDPGDYGQEHGRYLIYRYKIISAQTGSAKKAKQFSKTNVAASSLKELDHIDMIDDDPNGKNTGAFYSVIVNKENWKRDSYDSANYQEIVILDTIAGKDTIRLSYDNKGNVAARINHEFDTIQWDETWLGYEYWRGKEDNQLIIPGRNRPVKVILNDSLLVFSIEDKYKYASLFYIKRAADTFDIDADILTTETPYLYIDLKKNEIIEQAGRLDSDCRVEYRDEYSEKIPFTVNRYRLGKSNIEETQSIKLLSNEVNEIRNPDSYSGSKAFYKIAKQPKNWEHDK